ncbi:MAG: alpha/beta hydrolase [Gemmatimonadales bacterium]
MISAVLKIIAVLVVLYALGVFLAWRFQDRVAFPAPRGALPAPAAVGIPDGELVEVTTQDGVTLRGWYLPPNPAPAEGKAPGLLWFYGNMETIGGIAPVLREFRPPGIGMLVLDYRGYGQSGGRPTERGVYRDADAAWAYITSRPEIDDTRVAVYGRSIGSAVALYLATEQPVSAVVLESAFTSGRDMAEEHYAPVPSVLVELELDNVSRARELTVPLLVFHGSDDWIAPLPMGRAVAEAGRAEEFVVIDGAGHNDTYLEGGEEYRRRMHEFLREHLF